MRMSQVHRGDPRSKGLRPCTNRRGQHTWALWALGQVHLVYLASYQALCGVSYWVSYWVSFLALYQAS